MALLHNVYFWLKPEVSADQRAAFEQELRRLLTLDYLLDGFVGAPAPTEERPVADHSFDYTLSLTFKSQADHDFYQNECPDHRRFVEAGGPLFARVLVYDSAPLAER